MVLFFRGTIYERLGAFRGGGLPQISGCWWRNPCADCACQCNYDWRRILLLRLLLLFCGGLAEVQPTQERYGNEGWGLIIIGSLPVPCWFDARLQHDSVLTPVKQLLQKLYRQKQLSLKTQSLQLTGLSSVYTWVVWRVCEKRERPLCGDFTGCWIDVLSQSP